jgi:hypothetical protein
MNRRNFLGGLPAVGLAGYLAAPAQAKAETPKTPYSVPCTVKQGMGTLSMNYSTHKEVPMMTLKTTEGHSFGTAAFEQRPDGMFELVFKKCE